MVGGDRSARGIVLVTRKVLRGGGLVLVWRFGRGLLFFIHLSHSSSAWGGEGGGENGGWGVASGVEEVLLRAASSHVSRAVWSTGQVAEGFFLFAVAA